MLPLALFIFWIILTGSFTTKSLIIGLMAALIVSGCVVRFCIYRRTYSEKVMPLLIFLILSCFYLFWLLGELIKANIQVALIVLNPKMPISPQVVTFKSR